MRASGLFQRVFLEQIFGVIETLAGLGGFADLVRLDGRGLVAEVVAHVGEHSGDFVILEHPAVFLAGEFEGTDDKRRVP